MLRLVLLTVLASLALAVPRPEPRYMENVERVVGGEEVNARGAWPWQISLQWKSDSGYRHTCGGTLVTRDWVMTAAHCVDSDRVWRVVLGEHSFNTNEGTEQIREVSKVVIHSKWDPTNVAAGFDIAMIQLSKPATLNPYVLLGALPEPDEVLLHEHPCYLTGWGLTETGGSISNTLKQALLPVVDHATCTTDDWWGSTVQESMVCAGGGADSGCNGDSGGPLNCRVEGKYVVHGIASFVSSMGCNAPQKPTVFTRVSSYIDWMAEAMA
ncbi:elastase-1-like [Engraulis encrasicolus]|uniref:elastase-1-like n=1 Tax=Engraulis encrasicolus TaxID=184585 RepID=UPI002FD51FF6